MRLRIVVGRLLLALSVIAALSITLTTGNGGELSRVTLFVLILAMSVFFAVVLSNLWERALHFPRSRALRALAMVLMMVFTIVASFLLVSFMVGGIGGCR